MSRNTITVKGHGLNLVLNAGEFSGHPAYATCPYSIRKTLEKAFRDLIGDYEGGMSYRWNKSRCIQISENVFERRLPMELSLYHSDGRVYRQTDSTRRVFRVYCRQEFVN